MANYKGFAALTMVPTTRGVTVPVYAGERVPGDAQPAALARLVADRFVVDDVDGTVDHASWQTARDEENAAWRATQQETGELERAFAELSENPERLKAIIASLPEQNPDAGFTGDEIVTMLREGSMQQEQAS